MQWTLRKLVHPPKDHSELFEAGRSEVPVRPSQELEHHSGNQPFLPPSTPSSAHPTYSLRRSDVPRFDSLRLDQRNEHTTSSIRRRFSMSRGIHSHTRAGSVSSYFSRSSITSTASDASDKLRRSSSSASSSSTWSAISGMRTRAATMCSIIQPGSKTKVEPDEVSPGNLSSNHTSF